MYRSKTDSVFGGVCAGIGEAIDMNPWAVRILASLFLLTFHGIAIACYCIAWISIPIQP